MLNSSSSHAAKGEQVLGDRVKPSVESFECLKVLSNTNQDHSRLEPEVTDWLLGGYSAVVSMGTSTRTEAA